MKIMKKPFFLLCLLVATAPRRLQSDLGSVCTTSAPLNAVRQQNQNLDRALSRSSAWRCSLTTGAAGGAVVLRVAQQVFGHLICRLRQEAAFRAAQQEGAAGDKATNQHAALLPGHAPSS